MVPITALHPIALSPTAGTPQVRIQPSHGLRLVAPYEVVVDGVKVYQSDNGRSDWVCLVFTDDSHRTLWWTQALEDFAPAEQERVAALVKAKFGIDLDPF